MVLAAHAADTEVCCLEKQCTDRKNSTSLQWDSLELFGLFKLIENLLLSFFTRPLLRA